MGVPQFLQPVLESAGRRIDLSYFAQGIVSSSSSASSQRAGKRERRPLRIGVDVSSWIYRACQGHGDMLADERHMSNYGRAALHFSIDNNDNNSNGDGNSNNSNNNKTQQEEQAKVREYVAACTRYVMDRLSTLQKESKAEILVVLDGATPPIKLNEVQSRSQKRKEAEQQRDEPVDPTGDEKAQEIREKGNRRAGAGKHFSEVVSTVIQALRLNAIPFLVSPYEADGQLAYFANQGYIDMIVTEDSDLVAYGASPILFKLLDSIGEGVARGIMLRKEDLGTVTTTGSLDLMDFSPVMLAVMFVAVGSDYCKKLKGIGIVTACSLVRSAFLDKRLDKGSPLETVFEKIYHSTKERDLSDSFKEDFERNFLAAVFMYRHPIVFEPLQGRCIIVGDPGRHYGGAVGGGVDPELAVYEPYAQLCRDTDRRVAIAGALFESPISTYIAEGWISPRTMRPREDTKIPGYVQSFIDEQGKGDVDDNDDEVDDGEEFEDQNETQDTETQEATFVGTGADSEIPGDQVDVSVAYSQEIKSEEQGPALGQVVARQSTTKELDDSGSSNRKRQAPGLSEEATASGASPTNNVVRTVAPEVIEVLDDDSVEENLETQARMIV
jgi:5'-3' exonuclease